jgi:glycosidase
MVREDFPGGFQGDRKNKFVASGRSYQENQAYNFVSKLAAFRKTSSAISRGALMQYVPVNGLYVYFRYDKDQTIMCIINKDTLERTIDFNDYQERTKGFGRAGDIMTGSIHNFSDRFHIAPGKMVILELKKPAGKE